MTQTNVYAAFFLHVTYFGAELGIDKEQLEEYER
jgi:hypothetical protein